MKSAILLMLLAAATSVGAQPPKMQSEYLFPWDLGPAEVDVSRYPPAQRRAYLVFARDCSACHTLARSINAPFIDRGQWAPYVDQMHLHAEGRPRESIAPKDAAAILEFLVFDSHERKVRDEARFRAQAKRLEELFAAVRRERGR